MTILIIVGLLIAWILYRLVVWFVDQWIHAPVGWQDENGFHVGEEPKP